MPTFGGGSQDHNSTPGARAAAGDNAYSVKYLGIVDGAMGILSRKMAMQQHKKDAAAGSTEVIKAKQRLVLSSDFPLGVAPS